MSYLISNIPHFKCWVRKEFTCNHQRYHGEFIHALAIAVNTIPDRSLRFQVVFTGCEIDSDEDMPNVFIVPKDKTYDKIISNIEEIKSRKGKIIIITDSRDKILKNLANDLILIPKTNHYMFVVLATIVLQLFAYYIAVSKKINVDQPRNLAKSVTVE